MQLDLHHVEELLNFWGWPQSGTWELTLGGTQLLFNPKTLIMTWIVMGLVILFGLAATRSMDMRKPKGAQNILGLWGSSGAWSGIMDPKKGGFTEYSCSIYLYPVFQPDGLVPHLVRRQLTITNLVWPCTLSFNLYLRHRYKVWVISTASNHCVIPVINIIEDLENQLHDFPSLHAIYVSGVDKCCWVC